MFACNMLQVQNIIDYVYFYLIIMSISIKWLQIFLPGTKTLSR